MLLPAAKYLSYQDKIHLHDLSYIIYVLLVNCESDIIYKITVNVLVWIFKFSIFIFFISIRGLWVDPKYSEKSFKLYRGERENIIVSFK